MHKERHNPGGVAEGHASCLARSVVDEFAQNPGLEAVILDPARQTISVATLGKTDESALSSRILGRLEKSGVPESAANCTLLTKGTAECNVCETPLTPQERNSITVRRDEGSITIARITCPTAPRFWRWRDLPWPKVVQRDMEIADHDHDADEWKAQLGAAFLCGVLGLAAYGLRNISTLSLALYGMAYLAGAWFTVHEVWERLRKRAIDVHFLMLAVAAGSASIGAWGEGATLLFLFSLSGALEHFALGRTQKEIRALFRDAPKVATVLDARGQEKEVPVAQLRPGMRLLVKPNAQFPVDAEISKGQTASDESALTGESAPVEKAIGDKVLAGTMNLWGAVEADVLQAASESSLQKIIRLIQDAQRQKAPAQRFTDSFSTWFTYAVLALSLIMFFVWWRVGHPAFTSANGDRSAFYRAMTLLVVASPCALVLSIPSAVLAAIAWGARHGILFRGGAAVEKLAEVDTVALDKTGTLTTGELRVEKVESFPPGNEALIAQIAYSLERLSTHPLARALTRHGKKNQIASLAVEQFESVPGQGLRARHGDSLCLVGKKDWLGTMMKVSHENAGGAGEMSLSEIWVAHGPIMGRIVLRDDVRAQAKGLLGELGKAGLQTMVLTGDRKAAAENLKAELGLDDIRAELTPAQKLKEIQILSAQGRRVAMVGDGVNDAPSLAAAHIGVAMGARGSDAALEQADVVLMHDRLENFLAAFQLSQRARSVIRQNLVISLGTVAVLVTFALMGRIPLTVGVVGHEGSTVIVVMNSLRLLLGGERKETSNFKIQNS